MQIVGSIQNLTLENLEALTDISINNNAFKTLTLNNLPKLTSLDLCYTSITDETLTNILSQNNMQYKFKSQVSMNTFIKNTLKIPSIRRTVTNVVLNVVKEDPRVQF